MIIVNSAPLFYWVTRSIHPAMHTIHLHTHKCMHLHTHFTSLHHCHIKHVCIHLGLGDYMDWGFDCRFWDEPIYMHMSILVSFSAPNVNIYILFVHHFIIVRCGGLCRLEVCTYVTDTLCAPLYLHRTPVQKCTVQMAMNSALVRANIYTCKSYIP